MVQASVTLGKVAGAGSSLLRVENERCKELDGYANSFSFRLVSLSPG
jgi:hypothetical protein